MFNNSQTYSDIWQLCLNRIKEQTSAEEFAKWFQPIVPLEFDGTTLRLRVPNASYVYQIEKNYIPFLRPIISQLYGQQTRLHYAVPKAEAPKLDTETDSTAISRFATQNDTANIKNPFIIPGLKRVRIDPQLNPNYTFSTFIEGECNRLARSAGMSVAVNPGTTPFNPLYIYGDSGLGKTHIAQSIGHEVLQRHPELQVLYVSMNKFQAQFQTAHKRGEIPDFIHFYQMIDVLIIDDPYKDPKDAWSPTVRRSIQDWYDTVATTRLHNDSRQLITLTRWHQDDLAGVILKREPGEWEVVKFQAIKEGDPTDIDPRHEGEALWPERHSLARLLSAKQSNPHVFMSLYQQDPRPAEGLLFPAEALNYFEMEDIRGRTPDGVIAVADVADTGEDYYCMIVAYLFGNDIYVVDVIYTQDQAEITEPLTLGALDNWKVQRFRIESNAGGRLYAKSIREKAKGFTAIEAVPSSTNKETRILTASGQIKQRVHFRQDYAHGSDYEKFYDHFTSYTIRGPNEHDDAPDAVTMLITTAADNMLSWSLESD